MAKPAHNTAGTGRYLLPEGILGEVEVLADFNPIKDIHDDRYLTGFFSNYPTQEVIDSIFEFVSAHQIEP